MPVLSLHYQPIACLNTGQLAGCEALLRVNGGNPYPYLALRHREGTVPELTDWVMTTAMNQLNQWHGLQHDLWLSINLSEPDLRDPKLRDRLNFALLESGAPSRLVHLEISEDAHTDDALPTLRMINDMGFRLALDDAGSAWAGLSSLIDFGWDLIKLDRSMVPRSPNDYRRLAVIQGLVAIESTLGARLLCEGVEQDWQAQLIHAAGFELAQGWLWGRAVPAAEFRRAWL